MTNVPERMRTVALKAVGALIWPETDHIMTDAERMEGARRLVEHGDARASLYFRVVLDVAYQGERIGVDAVRDLMLGCTRRSA